MLNLSLIAASAAATLFAGVNAGEFGLIGKRTGGPAQPSCIDYTPFVYAGCFIDPGNPRALLYSSDLDRTTMTVEKCVAFCKGMPTVNLRFSRSDIAKETTMNTLAWNTMVNASVVLPSMESKRMSPSVTINVS